MKTNQLTILSVAKALIINASNEVLILTVGEFKERPDKSFKPDLPGGLVEKGESELDAVIREAEEETGIKLNADSTQLVCADNRVYSEGNESVSKLLYVSRLDSNPEVIISWEHASYEWVPIEDLLEKVKFRAFYQEAIEYCFNNKLL